MDYTRINRDNIEKIAMTAITIGAAAIIGTMMYAGIIQKEGSVKNANKYIANSVHEQMYKITK